MIFYNQNVEVDFYVPEDELAIQVSYSIEGSDATEKREVEALLPPLKLRHHVVLLHHFFKFDADKCKMRQKNAIFAKILRSDMHEFDFINRPKDLLTPEVVSILTRLHECRGQDFEAILSD